MLAQSRSAFAASTGRGRSQGVWRGFEPRRHTVARLLLRLSLLLELQRRQLRSLGQSLGRRKWRAGSIIQMTEVRGQRTEVGGQMSEIRGQSHRGQKSEVRSQRSEVRDQRSGDLFDLALSALLLALLSS